MNKENKLVIRILKRILLLAVVMFLLSVVVFWLARLAPGDPLQSFYGDSLEMMTSDEVAAARTRLGLDQGIGVQYVRWFTNVVHGDFGLSLKYRQPVMNVIKPLIGNTLMLGGIAYIVIFLLAVLIAIFCTLHEDQWIDRLICKIGTAAYYVPAFWLGVVLILIFSVNLGWFPSSGAYDVGMADSIGNRMSVGVGCIGKLFNIQHRQGGVGQWFRQRQPWCWAGTRRSALPRYSQARQRWR